MYLPPVHKHFYKYFLHCRRLENTGRAQVPGASWHRLKMIEKEKAYLAIKHTYAARNPDCRFDMATYRSVTKMVRQLAGRHFPLQMKVKMPLKAIGHDADRTAHAATYGGRYREACVCQNGRFKHED